ncbi:D-tagatose-bisphosphate aldolase, class II, non-catalytic subunit [Oryzifoliimicrobium ureilyticus]|uniref:D-tagatose-bisphosphate aldolase, class II, non-catalytic subunit n=1 Tax=Oryzifoliimicrobium ureilyticus TaxID=3113724 RepID=UPI00307627AD
MAINPLHDIAQWRTRKSGIRGIPSVCSAHPLVIEASMLRAMEADSLLLVEATCNQVNQEGGYTGMKPSDFRLFVEKIAKKVFFPLEKLILGGDHLGPNPWKHLPADDAMGRAAAMIEAYAKAGFAKLHLDTSMGCAGEPVALSDEMTAQRAARLASVAERAIEGSQAVLPVYVIGTEVPIPGGAMEELDILEVTSPEAAVETVEIHRKAFRDAGVENAFSRVIAAVVQPGVEFGNHNVIAYAPETAKALSASLARLPGMVFEAHSTDYQTPEALRQLVDDGFAILKVGPGLTFALREALYGLDAIASFLNPSARAQTLMETAEQVMIQKPENWNKYYKGSREELLIQRHFSYSDRIRYYWPQPEMTHSVEELFAFFEGQEIPETLISQYLNGLYPQVRSRKSGNSPKELVLASIQRVLDDYFMACEI